jgi:hypothetical protein
MIDVKVSDYGSSDNVLKDIKTINMKIEKEAKRALTRVWNDVYKEAISMCPVDTGTLVSSIKLVVSRSNDFNIGGELKESTFAISGKSASVFNGMIIAGDDKKMNPKNRMTSSQYCSIVHDGAYHNGTWVDGVPFLTMALEKYASKIEKAVNKSIIQAIGE